MEKKIKQNSKPFHRFTKKIKSIHYKLWTDRKLIYLHLANKDLDLFC
jgi:hypothetical protein